MFAFTQPILCAIGAIVLTGFLLWRVLKNPRLFKNKLDRELKPVDIQDATVYFLKYREMESRANAYLNEVHVYLNIGRHDFIAEFIGVHRDPEAIVLKNYGYGDLLGFMAGMLHNDQPIYVDSRIRWACQIAEGITYLHSVNIAWMDPHLGNILVGEDFSVVIADFAFSVYHPALDDGFTSCPPPQYVSPDSRIRKVDMFGFGTILFALLDYRFPFCEDLAPSMQKVCEVEMKHRDGDFDKLHSLVVQPTFVGILLDCWKGKIEFGEDIGKEMHRLTQYWSERWEGRQ